MNDLKKTDFAWIMELDAKKFNKEEEKLIKTLKKTNPPVFEERMLHVAVLYLVDPDGIEDKISRVYMIRTNHDSQNLANQYIHIYRNTNILFETDKNKNLLRLQIVPDAKCENLAHDPSWLVTAAEKTYPNRPAFAAGFKKCTRVERGYCQDSILELSFNSLEKPKWDENNTGCMNTALGHEVHFTICDDGENIGELDVLMGAKLYQTFDVD